MQGGEAEHDSRQGDESVCAKLNSLIDNVTAVILRPDIHPLIIYTLPVYDPIELLWTLARDIPNDF